MGGEPRIDGVILAAGQSTRMTRPKPTLRIGAETFLERAATTLRAAGCARVHVVAHEGAAWLAEADALGLDVVINADPESEQIDSLRLVLERLAADVAAVLVLPIDVPLVSAETARAVADAFRAVGAPIVLPFHKAVAGHPVLIGRALFDEVHGPGLEEGLRTLIMRHTGAVHEVRVPDPGVLVDIDTPDDYWRYIEQK